MFVWVKVVEFLSAIAFWGCDIALALNSEFSVDVLQTDRLMPPLVGSYS
ncbi:hypothetical protein [Oscillatoria sp. FACHB-1406]|nr:hypothetical protein [Oscillatoria sp. FACHB-1406]MBD2579713.1 hypothetical protein [Oscillatoria sp. FACHB-1406]